MTNDYIEPTPYDLGDTPTEDPADDDSDERPAAAGRTVVECADEMRDETEVLLAAIEAELDAAGCYQRMHKPAVGDSTHPWVLGIRALARERDEARAHIDAIDAILWPDRPDEERATITPEERLGLLDRVREQQEALPIGSGKKEAEEADRRQLVEALGEPALSWGEAIERAGWLVGRVKTLEMLRPAVTRATLLQAAELVRDITQAENGHPKNPRDRGGERAPLDAYYTPDELARALVGTLALPPGSVVWEPHAGGGAFVRALVAEGATVTASDVDPSAHGLDDAPCSFARDFLAFPPDRDNAPDWIVGNPPYDRAEEHVRHALGWAGIGVAFLLRLAFLEGRGRRAFWADHPPAEVRVLVERPSFTGGKTDSAAYGWFIWRRGHRGPPVLRWLSWRGNAGGEVTRG